MDDAAGIIQEAIDLYDPVAIFCLYSGGGDSTALLGVAREFSKEIPAAHINTGIGIEETRQHVRQQCRDCFNCPLLEYRACDYVRGDGTPDPQIYEQLILDQGFPGSNEFGHRKMYNRLKERPLLMMIREQAPKKGNVLLLAGCRKEESSRRMGNTKKFDKQGRWVWCNPLIDWSKNDVYHFIKSKGYKPNPVSELICHSGECGCGAFATPGQLQEWGHHFPYFKERIERLQQAVWDRFPWGWEESPPKWFLEQRKGQDLLFDMAPLMPMCTSCIVQADETGKDTNG